MTTETHAPELAKVPRTDTRQRILAVAAHLFATHGFAGTSIRDITEELGLTKASLYYHFQSKDELLQAIVSQPLLAVADVMAVERDLSSPAERKRLVIDVIGAVGHCDADVMALFKDPNAAPYVDESAFTTGITHPLAVALASGLGGVTDPADVKPADLMRAIAAVAAGYEAVQNWQLVYPQCEEFSPDDVEAIAGFVSDVLEAGRDHSPA